MAYNKLKRIIEQRGITQLELAHVAGVSDAFICYMFKGYKNPSVTVIKRIADYLGVTVDELID